MHLKPSLMFAHIRLVPYSNLQTLDSAWKRLPGTNAQAYLSHLYVRVKSLIKFAQGLITEGRGKPNTIHIMIMREVTKKKESWKTVYLIVKHSTFQLLWIRTQWGVIPANIRLGWQYFRTKQSFVNFAQGLITEVGGKPNTIHTMIIRFISEWGYKENRIMKNCLAYCQTLDLPITMDQDTVRCHTCKY